MTISADARQRAATERLWAAFGLPRSALERLDHLGDEDAPSAFRVSDLAAGAIGVAALALSELVAQAARPPAVRVDRRLAALWFAWSIRPAGWEMPGPWDPIAGDYPSGDGGWIRLHTNAPTHRAAALSVLGCAPERDQVAAAVGAWSAVELEDAVVGAGGCAAAMRSEVAWATHPQGGAVGAEPLVSVEPAGPASEPWRWRPEPSRPLAGLRVLDLTRVLAGPVATRFLAGYGASVLRIDPPAWDEPGVIPEVTPGKRCARLDLHSQADRAIFEARLAEADVIVHGYRPEALEGLGYGEATRREIAPSIIDVSLDAYGWTGPWRQRRGFDSLVQMSSGIAATGMSWKGADRPTPLPFQALDHATGYLMAATVIRGLIGRLTSGRALRGRLSLARTAAELVRLGSAGSAGAWSGLADADFQTGLEATTWGPAHRLKPAAVVDGAPMRWDTGASALGSGRPDWP
jgi:hypothetical protein